MRIGFIFELLILAALLILSSAQPASGCVCGGAKKPPCVAFREATAVFSGAVVDITGLPSQQDDLFHIVLVNFKVEQSCKGISGDSVAVATVTGTDCDLNFQTGESYFIYAYKDAKHNRLVTGVCTRTGGLIAAHDDVIYARSRSIHKLRPSILGADRYYSSALEGSKIFIEGHGRKYTAIADEEGRFSIELEEPGTYKVIIIGRSGYRFFNHLDTWRVFSVDGQPAVEFERKIVEGECDFLDFSELLTVKR